MSARTFYAAYGVFLFLLAITTGIAVALRQSPYTTESSMYFVIFIDIVAAAILFYENKYKTVDKSSEKATLF